MTAPRTPRASSSALGNRRFRALLLAVAGVPLLASYLWQTLVGPFLFQPRFSDQEFVYTASVAIHSGGDPYAWVAGGYSYGKPVYIYPPLWAWLQQPLLPLGREGAALALLVILQLCLAGFLVVLYRVLRPVDWQEVALGVILTAAFLPVFANLWSDQVNLVVLLLIGVTAFAYVRGDRWRGGAAYGVAMALKPLQPGLALLLVFGRRTQMFIAAIVLGLLASLLPGAAHLERYLLAVFGAASAATGFRDNAAPAGFLARLFHPDVFYDGAAPADPLLKALYIAVAVAVVAISWWRLGRSPRTDPGGRAAEVAVAVAASPLLLSIAHSFHLVLLLVPILVLLHLGLARADRLAVGAAAAAWLLVGPIHGAMLSAIGAGFSADLVLRVWNESQLAGIVVLWLGSLRELRVRPSSRPAPLSPPLLSTL
ncbi:MAG TPA: glycosyltransferase family 87 protein [Candidatus Dormibacteraeota bacterium]|nr:glycosyltransferase family 87 protein [Candidatus Dormibacteraeota bacterium]